MEFPAPKSAGPHPSKHPVCQVHPTELSCLSGQGNVGCQGLHLAEVHDIQQTFFNIIQKLLPLHLDGILRVTEASDSEEEEWELQMNHHTGTSHTSDH